MKLRDFMQDAIAGTLSAGKILHAAFCPNESSANLKQSFFHLEKFHHKWFLVRPDGCPFYLRDANH